MIDYGTLLNQNIEVIQNENYISLINIPNGMELARFTFDGNVDVWKNKGWYMTREEFDKARIRKELHKLNAEMINEE